jgi:hypothetical protein
MPSFGRWSAGRSTDIIVTAGRIKDNPVQVCYLNPKIRLLTRRMSPALEHNGIPVNKKGRLFGDIHLVLKFSGFILGLAKVGIHGIP